MIKPFEHYLAIIEDALECKLFDWQKDVLRDLYNGNHRYICYARHAGLRVLDMAILMLYYLMEKENWK